MLALLTPVARAVARSARALSTIIDPTKLTIERNKKPKAKTPVEKIKFGSIFTDHMLLCDWTATAGWAAPKIVPYGDFQFSPASSSLHYGLQCFEGMKAYLDDKDRIRLFRPEMNLARLNRSMSRLYMPTFNTDGLMKCMSELLKIDKSWIPRGNGNSLYIRPTGISTHPYVGVAPAASARVYVILCPVGPYYSAAVKLLADPQYVRAWPGGTGDVKVGGNYASAILPQMESAKQGCNQVLWLSGVDQQVTEVGTMNFFVYWTNDKGQKELLTCPLDGTVLPGVTRDSVLQITRKWGEFKVTEGHYTMPQLAKALGEGRVYEAFGTGTAAIVSPVDLIVYRGVKYPVKLDAKNPKSQFGPIAKRIMDNVLNIQYGRITSPWSVVVE